MIDNALPPKSSFVRVYALLNSPVFNRDSNEEVVWRPAFTELITLVDEVLLRAQQAGQRVDFLEGVGVNGKIQDITSLVEWMRSCVPALAADRPGQLPANRLNRYVDQGTGYFANGSFFTGEYDNEVAFFIDDQRIYLDRHLRRAVDEAEQHLLN